MTSYCVKNLKYAVVICEQCGTKFELYRKTSRKKGHVKHVYCHICKEVTAHIEDKA